MARFRYIYRTADRKRLEAEIDAESREAVFTQLRADGIRPIKVIALDGSKANGEPPVRPLWRKLLVWALTLLAVAVGGAAVFFAGRAATGGTDEKPEGDNVPTTLASPLARQTIPGNRTRILEAMSGAFGTATEKALAQFAEPGREFSMPEGQIDETDVKAALSRPLTFSATEFSESIDLKRIVSGMKRELNSYIALGGTWNDYLEELVKRQKLEISYRQTAHQKIHDALNGEHSDKAKAYDYWLKANAQLQSMGIYPLPLPDALRDYQFNLNLDE